MKKYTNKKLLILGGVPMLEEMVTYAQDNGAYVIVADYNEKSACKELSDEAWLVSTADTDTLAKMCLENNVNGVISGFDDFNIRCCRLLCDRIGLPFYATMPQIEKTLDKSNFKELCRLNNVPTTPLVEYKLGVNKISFPVIVKPVDGSGNRGITICYSKEELNNAITYAKSISKKNKLIIEEYIVGPEVGINYYLQDGDIVLSAMHDRYMIEGNGKHPRLPLAYIYPSKYLDLYMKHEDKLVIDMFRSINMKNGTLFMQGCLKENEVLFYEMGYRLNGAKQYQIIANETLVNPMHAIVNFSLKGNMGDDNLALEINPRFKNTYCTLSILVHPGRIDRIVGLSELQKRNDLLITQWLRAGDFLDDSALGTQKQIAMRITIYAEDHKSLATKINNVYDVLEIYDVNGNSMIFERFDTELLFES